ncbi:hypothetical protein C6I21_05310 [Alkalicoccus urumqiensis]|uniref:Uncharacterized protein n=1 Tax=Alkalicoccus urumqiensis TaxID=1548213 RepID=A0A2P6MIX1_ALKUR|nr:hypothetical protein C6I21_05310 [Alkalicoccus urumqiensis]
MRQYKPLLHRSLVSVDGASTLLGRSLPWACLQLFLMAFALRKDLQTALDSTGVPAERFEAQVNTDEKQKIRSRTDVYGAKIIS